MNNRELSNREPVKARPFIKWVGGKGGISRKVLEHLPNEIENYYEPFLGGGAIFFNARKRLKNAFLSDVNAQLVQVYKVIQNNIDDLIRILDIHKKSHSKDYYYNIRSMHNLDNPVKMSARFIYLNKTCYNGLYRVNKNNEFNVPMGSYKNPAILDEKNLRACHEVLQNVNIQFGSFEDIEVHKNSVIYCDPPYDETYNQYTVNKFERDIQEKLRDKVLEWSRQGAKVIISNADTDYIRELYKNSVFTIIDIEAPRYISCKTDGRDSTQELLIML
ncbi:MAG: hypothetical protein B0D92_03745 [Spirochaeta sp. LUC14_002_19_P3]|nr:MAG: hypothetical protein B0D92_03745 [Spirochaeta sp. LUC14_002_19_P3]